MKLEIEPEFSQPISELLERARDSAAVLGKFEPLGLMKHVGADVTEQRMAVLQRLSLDCEEVSSDGKVFWRLRPENRNRIISKLQDNAGLDKVAESARQLVVDDFGSMLSSAAQDELNVNIEEQGYNELVMMEQALSFTGKVQRQSDVQRQIQYKETINAFDFILPGKLIGRTKEIHQLKAFAQASEDKKFGNSVSLFLLTGNGGAGKSALLAEFARDELAKKEAGVPVIWLDFDRPMLASTDPVPLMIETARQLALFMPELRQDLKSFRRALELDAGTSETGGIAGERFLSHTYSLWQHHLGQALPIKRPIVIVLDTFEEAIMHGLWQSDRLQRWLNGLATEGMLTDLRAVVSGRELDKEWRESVLDQVVGTIELKDLNVPEAAELLALFLRIRGADPDDFRLDDLVKEFSGNPLFLKILAQYLGDAGPEVQNELLNGTPTAGLQTEFAQEFLYTRILGRIRTNDKDLAKLAFPGLALRRVTPDLVLKVLSKPCEILDVSNDRAIELVDSLRKQVWLVEADTQDGVIRHRSDLRRMMLKSVPSKMQTTIDDIHRLAATYYSNNQDQVLSVSAQQFEALYHRMMVGEVTDIVDRVDEAKLFVDMLGEDIESLPRDVLAQLKFAAGLQLDDEESSALGEESQQELSDEISIGATKSGYMPQQTRRGMQRTASKSRRSVEAGAGEAFAAGDLDFLADMVVPAIEDEFLTGRGYSQKARSARNRSAQFELTETASWRAVMATLAVGSRPRAGRYIVSALEELDRNGQIFEPIDHKRKDAVTYGMALATMASALGYPKWIERISQERQNFIHSIDSPGIIRVFQASCFSYDRDPIYLDLEMTRYLTKRTVKWLDVRCAETGMYERDMADWIDRMTSVEYPPLHALSPFTNGTVAINVESRGALLSRHVTLDELYLPILHFADRLSLAELVDVCLNSVPKPFAWPLELQPNNILKNLEHDRRRWTATLVNLVDRAGGLERFANRVFSYDPDGLGLKKLTAVYVKKWHYIESKNRSRRMSGWK